MKEKRYCAFCNTELHWRKHKYCNHKCHKEHIWKIKKSEILLNKIIYPPTKATTCAKMARRFVTERDGYKCSVCNISEWLSNKLVLILDHIDGNATNWHIDNLRFVCPNCDSQLPTYKSKNKHGRKYRRVGSKANGGKQF